MTEQGQAARDRHLFAPGPKRILALDGGGVRGVITVAFLERIEAIIAKQSGGPQKLCDYFDLVGGTSTGAIIAGGVALGQSTPQLKDIYHKLAPKVFERSRLRILLLQAKFDVTALREEIAKIVEDRTLDSPDLRTGFALIAKRLDTGSPWIVSNNPRAPYWNDPDDGKFIGNRKYLLANPVRASTAAPFYFDPETVPIADGEPLGLFVDGGVSPHNNPSLALLMMALQKPFGMNWRTGPDDLTIVSIGTGTFRYKLAISELGRLQTAYVLYSSLMSMMGDAGTAVLTQMQWLGQSPTPWRINSEIDALLHDTFPGGPMFRFLRYDVRLERDWLKDHLGIDMDDEEVQRLREMDNPGSIPLAYKIGQLAAERQVKEEHWSDGPDRDKASAML